MIAIVFKTGETYKSTYQSIYQYDYGQLLRIQGLNLPQAVEVHFSLQDTGGEATTRIGVTKDGVTDVVIPDSFLENRDTTQNYEIYAFVYLRNETSGRTEYKITMHVTSRPKPEAFDHPEDAEIFKEAIKAVNDSAARSAESEKQAEGWAHGREDLPERVQDNAKYYSEQAREDSKKTDADRKEVERLVESVSGIDEQVTKVENLTKQTQTSATNTALSEQAAKESENNAAQSRAGAEVAEDNAELAAQKAEQDKAIVEQAKNLVKQMGQEVLDNKNLVDKTAQDFILKAQQALADVNNAGQAQTERVQTAGTTAVENIQTTQGTAAEAVEAAKSEAVQAIQAEGITQTGKVTTEGTKQVQAVADKGKEVLQSIPEDFQTQMDSKLDKNQGAENTGKVLVVAEDGSVAPREPQEEGAPPIVNSVVGNLISVNDSAERKIKGLKVFGKSEQVQTTGAQLFNAREALASQIEKGVVSFDSDGKIILNGKFDSNNRQFNITLQPGTYTLSGDDNGIWHIIAKNDSVFRQTLVVDVETTYQCYIASNIYNNRVTTPMINIGDSAKSYEPYTGGKPSPSPECPQEIVTSGKLNEDTGKYEVGIKVTGKNLIPFPYPLLGGIGAKGTKNGVSWEILKDRGIKFTGKATGDVYIDILLSQELQDRKKFAYSKDLLSDAMNGKIFYAPLVGQSINTIYYPQIEHGTVATSYDPYREPQSLIFQTPNGLPGIPVSSGGIYTDSTGQQWVCDEIDLQRGVYVQRFKKVIIDQNTSLAADLGLYDTPEKITILFRHYDASIKKQGVILCRELLSSKDNWFVDAESANTTETGVDFRFTRERLGLGTETTPEENIIAVKKILETNPLHCLVELNVPIETPLSEDVIEAYKSLHTNYPTTVVTNDANVNMQLNYVADTKNFILNNIAQTNQAIVNTQAQLL